MPEAAAVLRPRLGTILGPRKIKDSKYQASSTVIKKWVSKDKATLYRPDPRMRLNHV